MFYFLVVLDVSLLQHNYRNSYDQDRDPASADHADYLFIWIICVAALELSTQGINFVDLHFRYNVSINTWKKYF